MSWDRCIFFFKQKTAYEMRISDWSSDVCSSDLHRPPTLGHSPVDAAHESDIRGSHQPLLPKQLESPGSLAGHDRAPVGPLPSPPLPDADRRVPPRRPDRKSTRLNSSH